MEEGNVGYSWALPVVAETWDGYLNDVNLIAWRLQHHPPSEDVIMTGPSRKPDSSTHVVPVISPFPFSVNRAPKTGSLESLPRGNPAVTPVRTGPTPTFNGPSPDINVV